MANSTLDITQPFDNPQKLLRIFDNGDGTYSLSASMSNEMVKEPYDYIALSYTSTNLTGVVYKLGGSSGTVVATLTLAYDGSNNLTSVTRT